MARLVVVSFRLGGTDGVSVEAAKWIDAFRSLGHEVSTLAGAGDAEVIMPELAMGATRSPTRVALEGALDGADLVVVENLTSLPLNVAGREMLYACLEDRSSLFRHHDLAWQRAASLNDVAPRDRPTWRHVTINDLSRRQLRERGILATTMYNSFDCEPPLGRRDETRRALGVTDEQLVLMPSRAIERKNVRGALALAEALESGFWILGDAEDGYDDELEALLSHTKVSVRRGLPEGFTVDDAYGACDLVVVASTWEGFGNPVLESVTHRRALAVYPYPVLEEIRSVGFRFFGLDDVSGVASFLERPQASLFDHNLDLAREHFNVASLPARLEALLESMGVNGRQLGFL